MKLDDKIQQKIFNNAGGNDQYAIAAAILHLADVHESIAVHLKYLGNGDTGSTMGAIEFLSTKVGEVADALSSGLSSLSDIAGQNRCLLPAGLR